MSLYPNLPAAFDKALKYVDLGKDEEKTKNESAIGNLKVSMNRYNSEIDNFMIVFFRNLENTIKASGLKMGDDKIRDMKKEVLSNMQMHV
jgi:hypothetical protein